jgi:hypothetical protein
LDHAARVADHVDIGFVGTLGLAHIGHFNQRIYFGYLTLPLLSAAGCPGS